MSTSPRDANEPIEDIEATLFALSFDTLSQALLFSASASRFHGWRSALQLTPRVYNLSSAADRQSVFHESVFSSPESEGYITSTRSPGDADTLLQGYGTERVDLAKKNPEKLQHLTALFEEQAQKYHLYPLITWDDVLNGKIHHTPGSKSFAEEAQMLLHPNNN